MTAPHDNKARDERYRPRDNTTGQFTFTVDRPCVCGHGLEYHTAETPRACGNYGTGLVDCDCRKYRPSRSKKHLTDNQKEQP